jgi:Glucose-6-phosphate dehydrogenase, C-terminal domain
VKPWQRAGEHPPKSTRPPAKGSIGRCCRKRYKIRYPDAYERLLMDVVRGDPILFMRRDEFEAAWAWVEPILEVWREQSQPPRSYPGSFGPRLRSRWLSARCTPGTTTRRDGAGRRRPRLSARSGAMAFHPRIAGVTHRVEAQRGRRVTASDR